MEIDRDKAIKLVIVVIGTLAALAVMSTLVQLIQTVLPFLIVAAGVYVGYRWALSDSAAPTADEVEEQARGIFGRFRKTRQAVETTMKVGAALNSKSDIKPDKKERRAKPADAAAAQAAKVSPAKASRSAARARRRADAKAAEAAAGAQEDAVNEMKRALANNPEGKVEFQDRDVVISKDDVVQPDISRLEEKEKEAPQVNNNVLAQIEERRRRLRGGE